MAEEGDPIIVKADEVDEAGADISIISDEDTTESEFNARIESRRVHDAQPGGSPKILANEAPIPLRPLARPPMRRETSAPPPPQQPPPPAPPRQPAETPGNTDSLSLQQLRRLVTDLPKLEPTAYAYEYADTRPFPEEINEWFQYTEEERLVLLRAKQNFEEEWEKAQATRTEPSDQALAYTERSTATQDRATFVSHQRHNLSSPDIGTRLKALDCLSYIVMGIWGLTAGKDLDEGEDDEVSYFGVKSSDPSLNGLRLQLQWIREGVKLVSSQDVASPLIEILTDYYDDDSDSDSQEASSSKPQEVTSLHFSQQTEINQCLTVLYFIVEVNRIQDPEILVTGSNHHDNFKEKLLLLLTKVLAKLRWEESSAFPVPRVLLLYWKLILLHFGDSRKFDEAKATICKDNVPDDERKEGFITTSPLDYHLFRQEITSKYPAYEPPLPLIPIEPENNSILPPLPNHVSRRASQNLQSPDGVGAGGASGSILYQPVHIATPAPSPPPSPAGPGGKVGKKQNYQTNQNLPFLYPPLDDTSNTIGGKGSAGLQGKLVGKRWEGGDVPASIQEAGQLFASRMRMSRPLGQLWEVREDFIRQERGWHERKDEEHAGNQDLGDSNRTRGLKGLVPSSSSPQSKMEQEPLGEDKKEVEDKVPAISSVEDYYRDALPYLQSLIVVLWKIAFANVSALVQANGSNNTANGFLLGDEPDGQKRKTNPSSAVELNGMKNGLLSESEDGTDPAVEELNTVRTREISLKAIAGSLIMLCKWFKLSHILKFEYLTQLLLDANYLPLILKLFAHQDTDVAVSQRNDRSDLDFFSFCRLNSVNYVPSPPRSPCPPSSPDSSAPPPIPKQRRSPSSQSPPMKPTSPPPPPPRPEVDELGHPLNDSLPPLPLDSYAPRFFFTTITLLRLLQKITKRKAHRALLLVQYKSSTILRRALKIPQPELRLYTLKLFKSQVPYCGRKWRQTNMRVITAVYLHVRAELRDEWLCGGDVDGVVEEAVPLEQACRSLVHWWHLQHYREVMEGPGSAHQDKSMESEEAKPKRDEDISFFERELDRMGWGVGEGGMGIESEDGGDRLEDGDPIGEDFKEWSRGAGHLV